MLDKSPEKKTHEFQIAGVPYKLRSSHGEILVKELVEFLNQRMSQALSVTKNGSYQNAAVLTALHLAEELLLLKRKASHELEALEEKILKLAHDLENSKKKV
jgi:cell division protein ZapA